MKKLSLHYLFILSIFFVCFSCSENSDSGIESQNTDTIVAATQMLNVSYGSDNSQVYDIYLPENRDENTKVLILVHGGGWTSGDKVDMNPYKDLVKQQLPNYAIVNINYRLASQGVSPFPMQLDDITTLINQLKIKQNEYIISQNYGFVGVSAGAHLAMLWSYDYDTEDNVNMVASIVGPTNLADSAYSSIINPAFLFFGEIPSTMFLENYSPLNQVKTTSAPTILFYGGMDTLIPNSQGIDMDTKLTELGVTHEFTFYANEGHGWTGTNLLDTWIKLKLFIETNH